MSETLSYSQVCQMLQCAIEQIRANHQHLSRLDAAVGDGDHGTTILRSMEAVAKAIADTTDRPRRTRLAALLTDLDTN